MLPTLFVYGTLRPGGVRWHHLAPFVDEGSGADALVDGALYDTGHGYPAARFDEPGTIVGKVYALLDPDAALAHLDEVEGAVAGLYHRVVVHTHDGAEAWAYECGDAALLLRPIDSGDWRQVSGTGSCG
jgi:gamma-glutamylcyclotransferase (GGCT)/AIG2-like uncharacterized protein YtfP